MCESALSDAEFRALARWIDDEDPFYGERITTLTDPDFAEVGLEARRRRELARNFGPPMHRPRRRRVGVPAADSALSSIEWREHMSRRVQRVLQSFAAARDGARVPLGLRPLSPNARGTTRTEALRWLGLGYLATPGSVERLIELHDWFEACRWLVNYSGIATREACLHHDACPLQPGYCGVLHPIPSVQVAFPTSCNELAVLSALAEDLVDALGVDEPDALMWLLIDRAPQVPLPLVAFETTSGSNADADDVDDEAGDIGADDASDIHAPPERKPLRYLIEVNSALVSPEEVAALYRRIRNRGYGLPTEPTVRANVWPAELVRFVAEQHLGREPDGGEATWKKLLRLWREIYPQKPYGSWRAMRDAYRKATRKQETADA